MTSESSNQDRAFRIMGIDPGSQVCGFAVIETFNRKACRPKDFAILDVGVIRLPLKKSFLQRMALLHESANQLMSDVHPHVVVLEESFFGINPRSALKLGQARGVLIGAASRSQSMVEEVTPAHVKRSIAGHGSADKASVARALEVLCGFHRGNLPFDATDALAIALTHGITRFYSGGLLHEKEANENSW